MKELQCTLVFSTTTTNVSVNLMYQETTDLSLTNNKCQDLFLEYLRQRDLNYPISPTCTAIHLAANFLSCLLNTGGVSFYFHGGFAILKLSSANRQTADLDMVVENGAEGYGVILGAINKEASIVQKLQSLKMASDFWPPIIH